MDQHFFEQALGHGIAQDRTHRLKHAVKLPPPRGPDSGEGFVHLRHIRKKRASVGLGTVLDAIGNKEAMGVDLEKIEQTLDLTIAE